MARRRTTGGAGRGLVVFVALSRIRLAEWAAELRGEPLELSDDDRAMARLTDEERRWCRRGIATEPPGLALADLVARRWGPFDPDDDDTAELGPLLYREPAPPPRLLAPR